MSAAASRLSDRKAIKADCGDASLDPTKNVAGDAKESFYLDRSSDSNAPLPSSLKSHETVISKFHSQCEQISLRLLAGMAAALGLPEKTFTSSHSGRENRLRLIHYPPFPASATERCDSPAHLRRLADKTFASVSICEHLNTQTMAQ